MFGATLQAALTLLVAAVLATFVQLRARPAPLRVHCSRCWSRWSSGPPA